MTKPSQKIPKKSLFVVAKKKETSMDVAKEALKKVRRLELEEEDKYFIAGYSTTVVDNATSPYWNQFCMNQIGAGTGEGQRVGNKVIMKELFIDMLFQMTGNVDGGQATRVVILQDRQAQPDSALTLATVFNDPSSNFNSVYSYDTQFDQRYKVLHDKVYQCNPVGIATTQSGGTTNGADLLNTQVHHRLRFSRGFIKSLYYNGTATSDFDKNAIYFLITRLNNSSNGAPVNPTINWYIKYSDS